jgi:hypothetical protein
VGKEVGEKNHWEGWQSEKKNQTTTMELGARSLNFIPKSPY